MELSVAHPVTTTNTPWSDRYALRAHGMKSSAIRELLKLIEDPAIISFAGGLPAPEVFPVAQIAAAAQRVLTENAASALQYGATEGYLPLRELLVRHMARYGIEVTPANVLVTAGAQQALDLVGKLFVNSGDRLLTEEPTYLGALQAFTAYQAQYVTVPIDEEGLCTDRLEEALRAGPKFLYVLPNFQNPGGVTLSLARRRRLVELASHYGTPIVEDDPYGQLRYEGSHLPPLVKLDAEHHDSACSGRPYRGGVIYLGSLSKTLAPGLRIGWMVAPEEVVARLVQMKQGMDLHTSTFSQRVACEVARGGFLDRHVRRLREVYGVRRDAMLAALARHFPPGVRWTRPQGGLFLWATLPEGFDTSELLREALKEKVAFVPGTSFHPNGGGRNTMRLNFSYARPEVIEEGIRRLGGVVARHLGA
ncbi:MAG TPA: PLP-dependent aminotransferase family protein [Thermoanaerobaculia bacterium]|nr:PLP-dependent aminotransferase family protein [Thermoanaerobaculia bacterium]